MAVNFARAPIVIPLTKTTVVRLAGEQIGIRKTLNVDMSKQGLSDLRYWIKEITIDDSQQQINRENPPTRLVVDNKESNHIDGVQRKTEVQFGNLLDQEIIRGVERQLMSSIKANATTPNQAKYGNMQYWEWALAPTRKDIAKPIHMTRQIELPPGAYLILRPKPNVKLMGMFNMWAARKDAGVPLSGPGRSRGRGFMAKGINTTKRSRVTKNYIIAAMFTKMFQNSGEIYKHGTPVVVIRSRRNTGYRRLRIVR